MASISKFTYKQGFYHITLGKHIYHVVPMLAWQGKEMYKDGDSHSMFKLTGSHEVARTLEDTSIKLSDHFYKEVDIKINNIDELKEFMLNHKPINVYQDHIKKQFIRTLVLWKEYKKL